MIRDSKRLLDRTFDLLVVGGGIYGAWTAYDAALRGLDVALIEKGDWASGTSSASSKLIHGGLRYLEQFHFGLVRKSLHERTKLLELAPHRVHHLKFLIPIYAGSRLGPLKLKAGLWLYDMLAGKKGIVHSREYVKRQDALSIYPFLSSDGLRGVCSYGDCQTDDFRFTLEIVNGASNAGAVAVNYVEALSLIVKNGRVLGAKVFDNVDDTTFEIHASVTVNTTGPWVTRLNRTDRLTNPIRLTKGVHLLLPSYDATAAILGISHHDGRVFFVIPWYGRTLIGTTDTSFEGNPDAVEIQKADVDYLLTSVNRILSDDLSWDRSSIIGQFVGLRALRNERGKSPSSITREWSLERTQERLLSSIGGKFTSARTDATIIVNSVLEILGKPVNGHAPTETHLFPWCPGENFDDWKKRIFGDCTVLGVDRETAENGIRRYGSCFKHIHELIRGNRLLGGRILPDLPFCKAEIIHAVKNEMAVTLNDVLRRRIPILLLAQPQKAVLKDVINLVGPTAGWTQERCQQELETTFKNWNLK